MEKTLFSVIILILVLLLLVPSGCLAMRSQPGILKWKYKTGYWVYSSPVIGEDGTVYVGCDDHYLYAIRPDGILKWKYKTGSWVRSSPAIGKDGTVYVGCDDGYLYAINGNSGGLASTPWPMFHHDVKHTGRE